MARPRAFPPFLVAAALFTAACSDPYGPNLSNDPARVAARLRGLDSVLTGRLFGANSALGVRFTPAREPGRLFADSLLGQTFEWDAATSGFILGTRPGAPASGVRLVLYAVQFGEPSQPLSEIGSADLTQGGGASPSLRVLLRNATNESAADLVHAGAFGTNAWWMTAAGYYRHNGRRVDVRARYDASPTVVTQDFELTLRDGALHVHSRVDTRVLGVTTRQDVVFALHASGEALTMTGWITSTPAPGTWSGVSNTADVVIHFNGRLFATLVGTDQAIALRDPDGSLLPLNVAGAIQTVFRYPGTLQMQLGDLLQPGLRVLRGI